MVSILYVGFKAQEAKRAIATYNRTANPEPPWRLQSIPIRDAGRTSKLEEWIEQDGQTYTCIAIDFSWLATVGHALKAHYQDTPIIMIYGNPKRINPKNMDLIDAHASYPAELPLALEKVLSSR